MNGKIDRYLHNKTIIFFDTAPLIYFIEEHPKYVSALEVIFTRIDNGILKAFSSCVSLLEVLVLPLKKGEYALAEQYREYLTQNPNFHLYPIDFAIAERAAELRAKYGDSALKTPDAIQLATAIFHDAQLFLTNDGQLKKLRQKEIEIVTVEELS